MKAASILGFVLIALGIAALVYCVSPIGLLVQATEQSETNSVLPILGGFALLFVTRQRN
jgi:hypothetical protein